MVRVISLYVSIHFCNIEESEMVFRSSLGNMLGKNSSNAPTSISSSIENVVVAPVKSSFVDSRKNILTAFTGLDLVLDTVTGTPSLSASRQRIQLKEKEKQEQVLDQVEMKIQDITFPTITAPPIMASAFTQALDQYEHEKDEGNKKKKVQLSRKAKRRGEMKQRKGENYETKVLQKTNRTVKKQQRRDRFKNLY